MGCDIHSFAEKYDGIRWRELGVEAFKDRNYGFFGWLAGVRNYSDMAPIAANRGLPVDASESVIRHYDEWGGDAHSPSWVSMSELLAVNYEQVVEDRRVTKQIGPGFWTGAATCEPGEGKLQTLREFLGPWFFEILKHLQDAKADRVVFWFDN